VKFQSIHAKQNKKFIPKFDKNLGCYTSRGLDVRLKNTTDPTHKEGGTQVSDELAITWMERCDIDKPWL
jgi:hypothetical protein